MDETNPHISSEILDKYKDSTGINMEVNKDTWDTMSKEEYADRLSKRNVDQKKHGEMIDSLYIHRIYISTIYNTMNQLRYLCNRLDDEDSDDCYIGYALSAALAYPFLLSNTILGFNDDSYFFEHEATDSELLILRCLIDDVSKCIPHFNAKVELALIRVSLKNCISCIDSFIEARKGEKNATPA